MAHLSAEQKEAYLEAAKALKGSDRRMFMARIVKSLGKGGQRQAEKELGWDRTTIRKGSKELGQTNRNAPPAKTRKPNKNKFPYLREHLRKIVETQRKTNPGFCTTQQCTRLDLKIICEALVNRFGYTWEQLPHLSTLRRKFNEISFLHRNRRS